MSKISRDVLDPAKTKTTSVGRQVVAKGLYILKIILMPPPRSIPQPTNPNPTWLGEGDGARAVGRDWVGYRGGLLGYYSISLSLSIYIYMPDGG